MANKNVFATVRLPRRSLLHGRVGHRMGIKGYPKDLYLWEGWEENIIGQREKQNYHPEGPQPGGQELDCPFRNVQI